MTDHTIRVQFSICTDLVLYYYYLSMSINCTTLAGLHMVDIGYQSKRIPRYNTKIMRFRFSNTTCVLFFNLFFIILRNQMVQYCYCFLSSKLVRFLIRSVFTAMWFLDLTVQPCQLTISENRDVDCCPQLEFC